MTPVPTLFPVAPRSSARPLVACALLISLAASALSTPGSAQVASQAAVVAKPPDTAAPKARSSAASTQPVQVALVPFASAESERRLTRSRYKADFFRLANQFEAQETLANCGPTSAVIVLNALRVDRTDIDKPVDAAAFPAEYRKGLPPGLEPVAARYTQATFFDARFEKVKPKARFFGAPAPDGARDPGLQLRQLAGILTEHGLRVEARVVDDSLEEATVRRELLENLATAGDFVLVNYSRAALGQPGGGHISPAAAYDKKSDSVLLLDVNPNRAPWVWVPMKALIAAMHTKDTQENRGYLLIREGMPRAAGNAAKPE